ncbi:MAG TPA: hypothetical protein VGC74_00660 [Stenotrophomonas sp.]|jgi:hypothetical protein
MINDQLPAPAAPAAPAPAAPSRNAQALAQLETAARRELMALARALPAAEPPDALLASLAWDLGLGGDRLPE